MEPDHDSAADFDWNRQTWAAYTRQKERAMGLPIGPEQGASEVARIQARYAYEQFVRESRARARRERAWQRAKAGLYILLGTAAVVGLLLWAEYATAAPLREPTQRERGLQEPDAAPQKGVTIAEAKRACEQRGGHWLEEDGGEQMPNHKIIGCLFAVPKSAK